MEKKQIVKLKSLIADYAKAYKEDAVKGGGHPDDYEAIETELKESKKRLYGYISSL